jgi:hypothetical protein
VSTITQFIKCSPDELVSNDESPTEIEVVILLYEVSLEF